MLIVLVFVAGCPNKPPNIPVKPMGPDTVARGTQATYSTFTTDPNGDAVSYIFDWGDEAYDTSAYLPSGDTVSLGYAWADTGLYSVRAKAQDEPGKFSCDWSEELMVYVGLNRPPNAPAVPDGPASGSLAVYHTFKTSTTDPDGDSLQIRFIWGNGTVSDWSPLMPGGMDVMDSVVYAQGGTYEIRAVAMDKHSLVSDTSDAKQFVALQTNTPPGKPVIVGPGRGIKSGPYYRFLASAIDPEGNRCKYKFFWGDGNESPWTELSNQAVPDSWKYSADGTYQIRVLAQDEFGLFSDTSDPKTFEVVGEGNVLYSLSFGDEVYSSPALTQAYDAQNRLRLAVAIGCTDEVLYAVDAYQGVNLYEAYETANDAYLCSPSVGTGNTVVYVGNGNGQVYAYDRAGNLKWHYPDSASGDDMWATPLVNGNTIYVGGEDRTITQLTYNGSSVTVEWSYQLTEELIASPVMDGSGNLIVCDDSGYVYSFAPDHTPNWIYYTGDNISASPAIAEDGTIYIGTEQGRLHAITSAGAPAWTYQIAAMVSIMSSPVIGLDGSIYFGAGDGCLYRLDNTGQPVASWPAQLTLYEISSTPAVCADGIVYVTGEDDVLYAVNDDASVAWSVDLQAVSDNHTPRPRHFGVDDLIPSPVIDQYGIVYTASWYGSLVAIAGRRTGTLADTPWPMFHHDVKHTGKYGSR